MRPRRPKQCCLQLAIALWCKNQIEHSIWDESLLFCNCACSQICLKHNNSLFETDNLLQIHGTAIGPKKACSYVDLAMGIIDGRARSGEIKPNLWWRFRDDIFYLWTQGPVKLNEFTEFINSLYPTIKFTLVSSLTY